MHAASFEQGLLEGHEQQLPGRVQGNCRKRRIIEPRIETSTTRVSDGSDAFQATLGTCQFYRLSLQTKYVSWPFMPFMHTLRVYA